MGYLNHQYGVAKHMAEEQVATATHDRQSI
jgi:hypothetical protein